jgi:hypothetical protein
MTGADWNRLVRQPASTAKIPSISTATPSGSDANPSAERA